MLKKKGILLKTFAFTSLLITVIVLISFGILFFILPDYYLYTKNKTLQKRADQLVSEIDGAKTEDELAQFISDFSLNNNATVMAFNSSDELVAHLSSPFVSMYSVSAEDSKRITVTLAKTNKDLTEDSTDGDLNHHAVISKSTILENPKSIALEGIPSGYVLKMRNSMDASHIEMTKKVNNTAIASITITSTLQPIDEAKSVMISLIPYLLLIDLLIALVAAYFYSKQLTKPIIHLSETAAEMQSLRPNISCKINTNDELGELSDNINALYIKLRANIENVKREMEKVSLLEKSKTDFMRAASHELKTPITAINGMIEGMIDHVGRYQDKERYLKECKKLIDHLSKLVHEILKASKLDTTEYILHMEKIDLWEIIEKNLENNKILIEENKLKLFLNKKNLEAYIDQTIIENTLSNIISNAVKYTKPNGQIHIFTSETEEVRILSIENECEPIPIDDLEKLFEPFYTRNYSRNRHKYKNGTGLGLYIVKKNLETLNLPYKLENTKLGLKFNIYFQKAPQCNAPS